MKFLPLKKKKEFTKALKTGKRYYYPSVTVIICPAADFRYAVCVGKKYGKSVERNHLKRLLREAFRFHAEKIKKSCIVLLLPKVAEEYTFQRFKRDIGIAIEKENRADTQA